MAQNLNIMSADDTSYVPKSPDFSSLFSSGPTDQAPPFDLGAPTYGQHLEPPSFSYGASYVPPTSTPSQGYNNYQTQTYVPPLQPDQGSYPQPLPVASQQQQQPYSQPHHLHDPSELPASTVFADPYPPSFPKPFSPQPQANSMPPRKAAAEPSPLAPPIIDSSMVKTKFPTARIKRIMQADEEVGKVAQQTPIAVGKALELFMIQLVSKSADIAKDKGSKRVTASMLKTVVESDEQWDFLREIVSRVETEKEGPKKEAKPKMESESEEEVMPVKKKRSERGAGRKKRGGAQ